MYNRDGVCLQRGTDWKFICNAGWSGRICSMCLCCHVSVSTVNTCVVHKTTHVPRLIAVLSLYELHRQTDRQTNASETESTTQQSASVLWMIFLNKRDSGTERHGLAKYTGWRSDCDKRRVTAVDTTGNIILRITFLLTKSINRQIKANVLRISELQNTSKSCALRCRQQHEERRLHYAILTVYCCSTDRLASYTEQKLHLRMSFHHINLSGHYMYHQFNIQQFYVLPTHCIYVFCVDLRTNSHYFPIQH